MYSSLRTSKHEWKIFQAVFSVTFSPLNYQLENGQTAQHWLAHAAIKVYKCEIAFHGKCPWLQHELLFSLALLIFFLFFAPLLFLLLLYLLPACRLRFLNSLIQISFRCPCTHTHTHSKQSRVLPVCVCVGCFLNMSRA